MIRLNDQRYILRQEPVSKSRFKAKALAFFRRVEASGEPVIVTDNGQPAIEVRRYRTDRRLPLERLRGSVVEFVEPTAAVSEDDWEALA